MSSLFNTIVNVAVIMEIVMFSSDARMAQFQVPPSFGCSNGRKAGLFRHSDVSACEGSWKGHVKEANLCSSGWHTCSHNDTDLFSAITWYEAVHLHGCYATNAAHNKGVCQSCTSEKDDMAGIGADCPHVNEASQSCFGKGKIDASCCSATYEYEACAHMPWISGVLCCKDKRIGAFPSITVSPLSSLQVPAGEETMLKCKATGEPEPSITWYKNGKPIVAEGLFDEITSEDGVVFSRLIMPRTTADSEGLYLCKATNRHGFAVSYASDVTVYQPMPDLKACKDKAEQQLLYSSVNNNIAACGGKWKGPVKKAARKLCAKGWHVCGLKDMATLNKLSWADATSLTGCYAYDVATSKNFACTKCSHRQKGNRMSGFGSGCGNVDEDLTSCLKQGRIDVWGDEEDEFDVGSQANKRSCNYQEGVTSGVMCCQKKKKSKERRNKKCPSTCGTNSHCTKRGICKCSKGFKMLGKTCMPKSKAKQRDRRCLKIKCQNGGRCWRGACKCPPLYTGLLCDQILATFKSEDVIH